MQKKGKARATGWAISTLDRLPQIFTDTYLLKAKIQLTLRLLDFNTEQSLRICIPKPCGGVRPLTVSHDDNVYLNGFAQRALQHLLSQHNVLPPNLCSYQKGKGCSNATLIDNIVKEVALQENQYYFAEIDDDAEKMFDRLYIELQIALLKLAGCGPQGFAEWQSAMMCNRTNRIITDVFTTVIEYQCGLPQGNGFSVEIANLYAWFLLTWWNMDPQNNQGDITDFDYPRHGYPLQANGSVLYVASLAYVDDANRYVAVKKSDMDVEEFFQLVQNYCDLLADLSLVIKMGRNVSKCTIILYNIPLGPNPTFTSTAWSYDEGGPVTGNIKTVIVRRDNEGNLIKYKIPDEQIKNAPDSIKDQQAIHKYLGVPNNAYRECTEGREKLKNKLKLRVQLVKKGTSSIEEARIAHNMLVNQVATFSPLCIDMSLEDCTEIDKYLANYYHISLGYLRHDAKHNIFISEKSGGHGLSSFTVEYMAAVIREVEVNINNNTDPSGHALRASLEAS